MCQWTHSSSSSFRGFTQHSLWRFLLLFLHKWLAMATAAAASLSHSSPLHSPPAFPCPLPPLHPPRTRLSLPPFPYSNAVALHYRRHLRLRRPQGPACFAYSSSSGNSPDYSSDPIDVIAHVQSKKVVVLGGSGFVGSAVCKAAIEKGIEVMSFSRSGRPSLNDAWVDQVIWIAGDVFYADWDGLLNGASAVVSTLGGFGTNEQMERLNGEANVLAVNAASNAGVPRFVYISVHDYNFPDYFKNVGYFSGKRRAEAEVLEKFPNTGTVLRPGFIYGKRRVNGLDIPLDIIGQPIEKFLSATETLTKPLSSLPASDLFLLPPVSVEDVALAVIKAVTDDDVFGIQTIEQIKELAAAVRL